MPDLELMPPPQETDIGDRLIQSKLRMELIRTLFPYFVFLLNCAPVGWAMWQPDLMRTITCGVFFVFSILSVHRARLLWKG